MEKKKLSAVISTAFVVMGLAMAPAAAVAAVAATPAGKTAQATPADARFKDIYTREWKWRVAEKLERDDDAPDASRGFARVDAPAQEARRVYWAGILRQLDAIKPASLSPAERINFAVYRAQIASLHDAQVFREFEQPVNADSAFWTGVTYSARRPLKTTQAYRNYLDQLEGIPAYFDEEIGNMRAGLARGFTPPKVTLAGRESTLLSVTEAKTPQDTVFYGPFKEMPSTMPAAEQEALRRQAVAIIADKVQPAHAKTLAFFRDEYVPKARTTLAAQDMPGGKDYYQSKIVEFTTTSLTADQIHAIGLAEMAKIRAEMHAIMQQVGFKGDLQAFLQFLRTDPQFYARTPAELLKSAAWTAKRFDAKADQYFGHLPRRRFAIVPVPDDQAPFWTAGRGGPGMYWVNTYNLPARPLYSLPALTLHESAPGHAFQIPLAQEQKGVPPFRRAYISAYGEGWALYTERLGAEMGIYETPYEVFGMLSYQAWRASRLVVDTGVHAKGWTREQAQAYLMENTALSKHEVETEVDRYISWPGQALSYYLGQMAIQEARARAEKALGPKFDIRNFHDTVLHMGSVPLPVLQQRIDAFIADGGPSPYPKES
jgi:uncharacterized protein (DUF885 family)